MYNCQYEKKMYKYFNNFYVKSIIYRKPKKTAIFRYMIFADRCIEVHLPYTVSYGKQ